MNRLAAMLLGALLAAAVMAAPAPPPRPWVTGWDKPVDPLGGRRFEQKGDRLTITVPGEGYDLDLRKGGGLNAPRLLRDAEGDFAVQVRVGGHFGKVAPGGQDVFRGLGLLVMDEKSFVTLRRAARQGDHLSVTGSDSRGWWYARGIAEPPPASPTYLRLERRGDGFTFKTSHDGKEWELAVKPSLDSHTAPAT
jgi:hypothetical protein